MKPSYKQMLELAAYGAGFEVNAAELTFDQLKELAAHVGNQEKVPTLRVANASVLTFAQLKELAAFGTAAIFFVFDQP